MKINTIIGICLCLLMVSCAANEGNDTENTATPIENVVSDASTWAEFWAQFQEATANKDVAALQSLTHFNEDLTKAIFQSDFEIFFNDSMRDFIASKDVDALFSQKDISQIFQDAKLLQWIEKGTDEETGETYESSLMIYFGKKDGKFGMFRWAMAG